VYCAQQQPQLLSAAAATLNLLHSSSSYRSRLQQQQHSLVSAATTTAFALACSNCGSRFRLQRQDLVLSVLLGAALSSSSCTQSRFQLQQLLQRCLLHSLVAAPACARQPSTQVSPSAAAIFAFTLPVAAAAPDTRIQWQQVLQCSSLCSRAQLQQQHSPSASAGAISVCAAAALDFSLSVRCSAHCLSSACSCSSPRSCIQRQQQLQCSRRFRPHHRQLH